MVIQSPTNYQPPSQSETNWTVTPRWSADSDEEMVKIAERKFEEKL